MNAMLTTQETAVLIERGAILLIAGDERRLRTLPKGRWIGGTIPYFMTVDGGVVDQERVFVTELPADVVDASVKSYEEAALPTIPADYPAEGCSFIILPAFTSLHLTFAKDAMGFPGIFDRPLVGWVSGMHLDEAGTVTPKVFDGTTGEVFEDRAVVLHTVLAPNRAAKVDILNLFEVSDAPAIRVESAGFSIGECDVGGVRQNVARYMVEHNVDSRWPLVTNYSGALINAGIQAIDTEKGVLQLYAPVFPGNDYFFARPLTSYAERFTAEMASRQAEPVFACNCLLNFLYAGLEGKKTGNVVGPITYGEIAYVLLNQTLVYVTIEEI